MSPEFIISLSLIVIIVAIFLYVLFELVSQSRAEEEAIEEYYDNPSYEDLIGKDKFKDYVRNKQEAKSKRTNYPGGEAPEFDDLVTSTVVLSSSNHYSHDHTTSSSTSDYSSSDSGSSGGAD